MKPIEVFDHAIGRALYLVDMHDLLCNCREREIRADWAENFRDLMHWNKKDTLVRVDGKGKQCVMVFRNHPTLTMGHFEADCLGELLRAGVVGGVSALDRYLHDLVVCHSMKLLTGAATKVPKRLAAFPIPLIDAEASVAHALQGGPGGSTKPRPRNTLKERFRSALHKQTFQSATEVEEAFAMLGISKCWSKIDAKLTGPAEALRKRLNSLVFRRNQIVHEGDMVRSAKPQKVKLHAIAAADVRADLDWLKQFGKAIDEIVDAAL